MPWTGVTSARTKIFLQHHLGHLGEMLGLELLRLRQLIPHPFLPCLVEEEDAWHVRCRPYWVDPSTGHHHHDSPYIFRHAGIIHPACFHCKVRHMRANCGVTCGKQGTPQESEPPILLPLKRFVMRSDASICHLKRHSLV